MFLPGGGFSERRTMLVDRFIEAAAGARRGAALDELARKLWRAHGEGHIADAEALSESIEARKAALLARSCCGIRRSARRPPVGFLEALRRGPRVGRPRGATLGLPQRQERALLPVLRGLRAKLGVDIAPRAERKLNADSTDLLFQGLTWFNKGYTAETLAKARE
jgi:hypothetical protein